MEEASKLVEELLERNLLLGINTDSRLYSEYFRILNSVGNDNLFVGPELDILFVDFIKRLYHEGKIHEAATILRELELRKDTRRSSSIL